MTAGQINEAIAEACGWTGSWHHLPDYCGSLDAMWEAEACLTPDQQDDFAYYLSEIVAPITGESWKSIHASAMSRAKAFLRTVGKWEEGEWEEIGKVQTFGKAEEIGKWEEAK